MLLSFTLLGCSGLGLGSVGEPVEEFTSTADVPMEAPFAFFIVRESGQTEITIYDSATSENGIEHEMTILFPNGIPGAQRLDISSFDPETWPGSTRVAEYNYSDFVRAQANEESTFRSVSMFSTSGRIALDDTTDDLVGSFTIEFEGDDTEFFVNDPGVSPPDSSGGPLAATISGNFIAPRLSRP